MSYSFISDFWKINLLGKAIFFEQNQNICLVSGGIVEIGPKEYLFIHGLKTYNEDSSLVTRNLSASLIKRTSHKIEILELELLCSELQNFKTLDADQVFAYFNEFKTNYMESNKLLVSLNRHLSSTEKTIDHHLRGLDVNALENTLTDSEKDQVKLTESFNGYIDANNGFISILGIEQKMFEALHTSHQIQQAYFAEHIRFACDLNTDQKTDLMKFGLSEISILDRMILIEPFIFVHSKSFMVEKVSFEKVVQSFISSLMAHGAEWFPNSYIGLFGSIYFKHKYAYVFSNGASISYFLVDSELMLDLDKTSRVVTTESCSKYLSDIDRFKGSFSRLFTYNQDFYETSLMNFMLVLHHVSKQSMAELAAHIKVFEIGLIQHEMNKNTDFMVIDDAFEHKTVVDLHKLLKIQNEIGLFDFIDQHTGKECLYSTYACNQLKLNVNEKVFRFNPEQYVEGIIKNIPGHGNVLCVEVNTANKRLELKLPVAYIERIESYIDASVCIVIVNSQVQHYILPVFSSYQFLAKAKSNFEMFHLAHKILYLSHQYHRNFINTLSNHLEVDYGFDLSTQDSMQKLDDIKKSLLNIFGYSKLQMIKPDMIHLKIWHEVVEQLKVIINIHSNKLQMVMSLCISESIIPIALFNAVDGELILVAESKTKDDQVCQSEWADIYSINLELENLAYIRTTTDMPDGWNSIYEWTRHIFTSKERPVLFQNREVKQSFLAFLAKMPDWFSNVDQHESFDRITFRKIFHKFSRCIEYMLVTSELDKPISIFKPYKMYMDDNKVMLEGHYIKNVAEFLYVFAPDQNSREQLLQLLMTYFKPKYQELALDELICVVERAEVMSDHPAELAKLRPVALLPELSCLPVQLESNQKLPFFEIIQTTMIHEYLNLEKNHFVYHGDL